MTSPGDALSARFGESGLRRLGSFGAGPVDAEAPESAALARVAALVLPLQVGPYFQTLPDEAVSLREYAVQTDESLGSAEYLSWARLGSDRAYDLVVSPEGQVSAMLLGYDEPLRYVSSSPEEFADALLGLDLLLGAVSATDDPDTASTAFFAFERRLKEADPAAFAARESWWPLVLDDIRDTSSVENYAAFEITAADGEKKIYTSAGAISLHPEERLWSALEGAGVRPEQVTGIHTDLEACYLPGHYCSMWLASTFPQAKLTHSFSYGESAASRGEGIAALRAATARRDSEA